MKMTADPQKFKYSNDKISQVLKSVSDCYKHISDYFLKEQPNTKYQKKIL